jgi:hypothetical protein
MMVAATSVAVPIRELRLPTRTTSVLADVNESD